MKQLIRLCGLLIFLFVGAALTGCNTGEGIGEDLEEAGDEIEDAFD